jgi:quinol monooxygenase YgiN
MINHLVLLKLKPTTSVQERGQLIAQWTALAEQIEGIVQIQVYEDILHTEDSFDLGMFVTFTDKAGLRRYGENPDRQAVSALTRSLCERVVLFDYEINRPLCIFLL